MDIWPEFELILNFYLYTAPFNDDWNTRKKKNLKRFWVDSVDTGCKLDVHKTFNLRPVSTGEFFGRYRNNFIATLAKVKEDILDNLRR